MKDIPNLLDEINDDTDRLAYASKSYWNVTDALGKDSGNNDRLIELIRHIDVGQVARPSLDRSTHFLPMNTQQSLDFDNRKHDYMLEILNNLHEKYHVMIPGERMFCSANSFNGCTAHWHVGSILKGDQFEHPPGFLILL